MHGSGRDDGVRAIYTWDNPRGLTAGAALATELACGPHIGAVGKTFMSVVLY